MSSTPSTRDPASFRDPSGFIFRRDGTVYRQVNSVCASDYEQLMMSGLYEDLARRGMLIPHEEAAVQPEDAALAYKVLRPELVPFISYPYEWCFGQLKDAGLLILKIQKRALRHDMSLKDASAYNIQYTHGHPVLIDTLSFEQYERGTPWTAYRQFCQHFLAPLALMSRRDVRLGQLSRINLDGVPLDLASRLLPLRSWLPGPLLLHVHLHARSIRRYAGGRPVSPARRETFGHDAFMGLINSLESAIKKLDWRPEHTDWARYYGGLSNYAPEASDHKQTVVREWLAEIKPRTVWDLGSNTGLYSRIASGMGCETVAFDVDPGCTELSYRNIRGSGETCLLPLVLDLTNPSPGLGWNGNERLALESRGPADAAMALALVHHLAIGNNLPLPMFADFLARVSRAAIVEFVPKEDPQAAKLLAGRRDVFPDYTLDGLRNALGSRFTIAREVRIADSQRTLLLVWAAP
jgi:hypothetical protein